MPELPFHEAALDRALIAAGGLHEFIRTFWPVVVPARFCDNWHIGAMCEALEALQRKEIKRLLINVPPGTTKSLTVSVLWPAWLWALDPSLKIMAASFDAQLALGHGQKHREVVESVRYKAAYGDLLSPFKKQKGMFYTKAGGFRMSTSIGGKATGNHADIQMVDDPIKPKDTQGGSDQTRTVLRKVEDWWEGTMATRATNLSDLIRLVLMQRLHDADLCGSLRVRGDYGELVLPMRYEPKRAANVIVKGIPLVRRSGKPWDERTVDGELLYPSRFPEEAVAQLEADLGAFASAQLQQDPVAATGGIFQRDWMKQFWSPGGEISGTIPLPPLSEGTSLFSWDMAFKKTAESDMVVGQAWMRAGARFFLLDQSRDRRTYTESKEELVRFAYRYPQIITKLVEDKANGSAILDDLAKDVPGLEPIEPEGGKESRANAVAPLFKAGNVILPHPSLPGMGWVTAYIDEMARFPKAPFDDVVDATSQALSRLYTKTSRLNEAMQVLRQEMALPIALPAVVSKHAYIPPDPGAFADFIKRTRGGTGSPQEPT